MGAAELWLVRHGESIGNVAASQAGATGADVIHSWWVPAFGVKKDGIPGFVNEAWFNIDADKAGLYRGQCAELCGRDHGFMPIVVDARSKGDFEAWLKEKAEQQKQAAAPAAATPTAGGPAITTPIAAAQTAASVTLAKADAR